MTPARTHRPAGRWSRLAVVALLASAAAWGQPGLYGPEAPLDAAWVRILNAEASGGMAMRVGDAATVVVALGDATRYVQVPPGAVRLDVGGVDVRIEVEPESFTTVAATPAGPVVVPDPVLRDISRGLLGLMNLTGRPGLDLRAPDGTPVVEGTPPGEHRALAVAAATTELLVTAGDELIARLPERTYERGVAYTYAVLDVGEGPVVHLLSSAAE
jgi:alginate O-acetyltransferase complex protein AlgF